MGTTEAWTYSRSNLEELVDDVKAIVIFALVSEELLDKEEANNWSKTHTLILRKKSFFQTVLEKITKTDDIDISKYFSGSTVTSESYRCSMNKLLMYENENPRIPIKVLHNVKTKVQPFRLKSSRKVRHIKQFTDHSFRVGNSKK